MLTRLDKQKLFNKALHGVRAQGRKSAITKNIGGEPKAVCLYHGGDGVACGVGHCIDDVTLRQRMDNHQNGQGIGPILASEHNPLLREDVRRALGTDGSFQDETFLVDLQGVHDLSTGSDAEWLDDFDKRMAEVARRYELIYTPR